MHIYQFMAVVGRMGDQLLTNEAGEVTSHLQGMFMRTVRMLEAGIKPIYVFDGKPPQAKRDELERRREKRVEAQEGVEEAKETGTEADVEKLAKRTIRVTKEHNDECKRLLRLMGVPIIEAPSEAEAQCSELVRGGLAYGAASDDMDTLTFATPRMLRHLMAPASKQQDVLEYDRERVLEELGLTSDQFIDLCILLGCDYAGTIRGRWRLPSFSLPRCWPDWRESGCVQVSARFVHWTSSASMGPSRTSWGSLTGASTRSLTTLTTRPPASCSRAPRLPPASSWAMQSSGRPLMWRAWSSSWSRRRASTRRGYARHWTRSRTPRARPARAASSRSSARPPSTRLHWARRRKSQQRGRGQGRPRRASSGPSAGSARRRSSMPCVWLQVAAWARAYCVKRLQPMQLLPSE